MSTYESKLNPELRVVLRFIQLFAVGGLIYSVMTLAGMTAPNAVRWLHILYAAWFCLTIVSVEAILVRIRAGVITLIISTFVVTAAELLTGAASIGGASLGLLLVFLVVVYIQPYWEVFD